MGIRCLGFHFFPSRGRLGIFFVANFDATKTIVLCHNSPLTLSLTKHKISNFTMNLSQAQGRRPKLDKKYIINIKEMIFNIYHLITFPFFLYFFSSICFTSKILKHFSVPFICEQSRGGLLRERRWHREGPGCEQQ